MGHIERQRISNTRKFVTQLGNLDVPSGCFQASILAMGGSSIHLHDVVTSYENRVGIQNIPAYLFKQGLSIGSSLIIDMPLSLSQTRKMLESPKVVITELNPKDNSDKRVVGMLFAFGEYRNEPPHVIGILPREDMTRNLRRILKNADSHLIIDTSLVNEPVYIMPTEDIARNLNAFIINNISVSLHIVTKLKD